MLITLKDNKNKLVVKDILDIDICLWKVKRANTMWS